MNHFCLDVLQRITIPDFLDFMRATFPYLYAVDTDNSTIVDIHVPDQAYMVMHEHVVRHRFPNLVGGFDQGIKTKLDGLAATSMNVVNSFAMRVESGAHRRLLARALNKVAAKLIETKPFNTPAVTKPTGSLQADSMPSSVASGAAFEVPVKLNNEGKEPWYGYGNHPVVLCYHWQNASGSYVVYDGVRTGLQCQVVPPGKSINEIVRVVAPSEKGNFKLILTVVQEGVCWFEGKSFKCANGMVAIV